MRDQTVDVKPDFTYHLAHMTYEGRVEHTFGVPFLDNLREKIPNGRILEVGTSTRETTEELSRIFGSDVQVVGIDVNPDVLGSRRELFRKTHTSLAQNVERTYNDPGKDPLVALADGYTPPFAEDTFEATFWMNSLYQVLSKLGMSDEDLQTALREVVRVTKPNGFICISGLAGGVTEPYIVFQLDQEKKVHQFAEKDTSDSTKDYVTPGDIFDRLRNAFDTINGRSKIDTTD